MRLHPEEFHIQMAATACVYNLTKGDIGQKIHPHVLREVVNCTLAAMENFPNHLQVSSCCKFPSYTLRIFVTNKVDFQVTEKHALDAV